MTWTRWCWRSRSGHCGGVPAAQGCRRRILSKATRTPSAPAWACSAGAAPTATAWMRAASAAPDITQVWASGRTDDGLFKTIKERHAGHRDAGQPAHRRSRGWQILAYLRTLAAPAPTDPPRGNAENGEKIFRAKCAELSSGERRRRAPGARPVARRRRAVARDDRCCGFAAASKRFRPGYEPVTLTPQTGQPIHGVKKNEDLFSVQIMDTRERIQGYEKDKMKAVENGTRSAMPAFGSDRLSDGDLDDLLRYLQTLRGFDPAVRSIGGLCAPRLFASSGSCCCSAPAPSALTAQQAPPPPLVTSQEILDGLPADGSRWLTFGGDYTNQRHSPLTQITPANVNRLVPQWTFQTGTLGNFETTSLLRDNVLYVTGPQNVAWALDARTGRQIWRYRRELPPEPDRLLRARQPRVRRARRQAVHDHARRASPGARHEDRRHRLGRDAARTTRTATPRRLRRSS